MVIFGFHAKKVYPMHFSNLPYGEGLKNATNKWNLCGTL